MLERLIRRAREAMSGGELSQLRAMVAVADEITKELRDRLVTMERSIVAARKREADLVGQLAIVEYDANERMTEDLARAYLALDEIASSVSANASGTAKRLARIAAEARDAIGKAKVVADSDSQGALWPTPVEVKA